MPRKTRNSELLAEEMCETVETQPSKKKKTTKTRVEGETAATASTSVNENMEGNSSGGTPLDKSKYTAMEKRESIHESMNTSSGISETSPSSVHSNIFSKLSGGKGNLSSSAKR
jgi:hypothetical protein